MKTLQPNDWSKILDEHLKYGETNMGKDKQILWYQNGIAYLVVFGFAVWLVAVSVAGLWAAFMEAIK